MQNRLRHLESLVIDMMNDQQSKIASPSPRSAPTAATNRSTNEASSPTAREERRNRSELSGFEDVEIEAEPLVATTSGQVVVGENETIYVGATHWAAILDDVR
jgi:hypothetical protein